MLKVPEYILHDTVTLILKFLRANYDAAVVATDETDSHLYLLTGENEVIFERLKYFEQAKKIFIQNDQGSPRFLDVDLGFNLQHDKLPSIHIVMPSESDTQQALGQGDGYISDIEETSGTSLNVYNSRYGAMYDIVIFSDNMNEVVIIYHVLRALLVSTQFHLHQQGLQKIRITGTDLSPYMDLAPKNMYSRAIRLNFEYESQAISLYSEPFPTGINFTGNTIDE